jgi:hypothetical protein
MVRDGAGIDRHRLTQTEPVAKTSPDAKPKTWTFSISLGWEKPLQIKGTISVDDHAATAP